MEKYVELLPNIYYFYSDEYNPVHEFDDKYEILRTTAVCTDKSWVVCPNCTKNEWSQFPSTYERYAEANIQNDSTGEIDHYAFLLINNFFLA